MHSSWIGFLVLALSITSVTCGSVGSVQPKAQASQNELVKLNAALATISEERFGQVEATESKISAKGELRQAQFIDGNNGWVADRMYVYRTVDGGKSWKQLTLGLNEQSYITSLFFITQKHGWLTVVNQSTEKQNGHAGSSSIWFTSDGGGRWVEQSVFRERITVNDVSFVDVNRGIAIGGKLLDQNPYYGEIFAAITDDGGKTWKNISSGVISVISTPYRPGNNYGNKVYWLSPSHIFLLTMGDRIVGSEDGGATWTTIVQFEQEGPSYMKSALYKLVFDSQKRFIVLAGAQGDEGYWANLIVPDQKDSWQSNRLIRIPLLDAILLSDGEVIACGRELQPDEQTKQHARAVGIVLHSKDGGKTWSPVYRTRSEETLISLAKFNESDFYAVSDAGNFIKFKIR